MTNKQYSNCVIYANDAWYKLTKAKELGVKTLNEDDIFKKENI